MSDGATHPAPIAMNWQCHCDNCRKVIETKDAYYCELCDMTLCRFCFEVNGCKGKKESTPCPTKRVIINGDL